MFNADDYNDNIDYCKYVWSKNEELNLGLDSSLEIQYIANNYADEVIARRGYDEEVYENDNILKSVVEKHTKKLNKFKSSKSKIDEDEIDTRLSADREFSKFGGYGYTDSYDDHGLDEVVEESRHR